MSALPIHNATGRLLLRWLGLVAPALGITALLVGGFAWWQHHQRSAGQMGLAEALWVERDNYHYYGPGTAQSQSVTQALIRQRPTLAGQRYDSFVLWRQDAVRSDASASEPLLLLGFDPLALPSEQKYLAP